MTYSSSATTVLLLKTIGLLFKSLVAKAVTLLLKNILKGTENVSDLEGKEYTHC